MKGSVVVWVWDMRSAVGQRTRLSAYRVAKEGGELEQRIGEVIQGIGDT